MCLQNGVACCVQKICCELRGSLSICCKGEAKWSRLPQCGLHKKVAPRSKVVRCNLNACHLDVLI